MKMTYVVTRRFFDKLCGINLAAGCSIVLSDDGRKVEWRDQQGEELAFPYNSPVSLKEKYDSFVAAGVLSKSTS